MDYVTVTIYAQGAQVGTIPHGYADQVAPGTSVDVSPPIDIINAIGEAAQNASSCSAAVS
jgi:hypothetical protein